MQATDSPPLDPAATLQSLFTAWNGHAYVLVAALVVAALVAIAKQGWASAWLASHLPSKSLPFLAMALGILATAAAQIQAGVPWLQALINGILAGALATAGHQAVIESMRGGKEIVPATAKVSAQAPPQDPPVSPPGSVVVQAAVVSAAPSKQSRPPSAARRSFVLATGMLFAAMATGCASWWQQFKDNPGKFAQDFASYVEVALQAAVQLWTVLAPLLGASATDATAKFNAAIAGANNALGLLLDAVHAAVEAQTPAPDFSKLMADVQDAFARVMAVYNEFKAHVPATALGAQADTLTHQAQVIAAWRR